jgi:hypothetical protein
MAHNTNTFCTKYVVNQSKQNFLLSLATELIVRGHSADFIDHDRIYITMSALHILTAAQIKRKLACL